MPVGAQRECDAGARQPGVAACDDRVAGRARRACPRAPAGDEVDAEPRTLSSSSRVLVRASKTLVSPPAAGPSAGIGTRRPMTRLPLELGARRLAARGSSQARVVDQLERAPRARSVERGGRKAAGQADARSRRARARDHRIDVRVRRRSRRCRRRSWRVARAARGARLRARERRPRIASRRRAARWRHLTFALRPPPSAPRVSRAAATRARRVSPATPLRRSGLTVTRRRGRRSAPVGVIGSVVGAAGVSASRPRGGDHRHLRRDWDSCGSSTFAHRRDLDVRRSGEQLDRRKPARA